MKKYNAKLVYFQRFAQRFVTFFIECCLLQSKTSDIYPKSDKSLGPVDRGFTSTCFTYICMFKIFDIRKWTGADPVACFFDSDKINTLEWQSNHIVSRNVNYVTIKKQATGSAPVHFLISNVLNIQIYVKACGRKARSTGPSDLSLFG